MYLIDNELVVKIVFNPPFLSGNIYTGLAYQVGFNDLSDLAS